MTATSKPQLESKTPAAPLAASAPRPRRQSQTNAGFKRCAAAWRRAFKAALEGTEADEIDKVLAAQDAGEAYCDAMPLLSGYESIRDFIACAAHGIVTGAISPKKGTQLISAARVALATLNHEPKK